MELHTPIGSKIVFEKWSDGKEEYVAVNLVYQAVEQLQGHTLLSLDVPPMVLPVTVKGLTVNSDGLYRFADLDARFAEAMEEYEAISDTPDAVGAVRQSGNAQPSVIYNLQGQRISHLQQGVNIVGGEKMVVK